MSPAVRHAMASPWLINTKRRINAARLGEAGRQTSPGSSDGNLLKARRRRLGETTHTHKSAIAHCARMRSETINCAGLESSAVLRGGKILTI